MKNIKLLFIGLAVIFAFTGCGDSSKDTPGPDVGDGTVIGEWHMISWSTLTAADIYISFSEDGTFKLYQRLYTPGYVHLNGTYSYSKPALSGNYSDNSSWGSSYRVSFNSDGTKMTLTSTTSSTGDASVFIKTTIPSEITSGELEVRAMQSSVSEDMPRFL